MQKPTSTNGRRIAAAMFLGAASTTMVAGTAHADGVTGAKVDPQTRDEGSVFMAGGTHHTDEMPTTLIGLDAPGSSNPLWTYCIQMNTYLQDEPYDEHDWDSETKNVGIDQQHLEGIKWILNNSYPEQTDLGQLAASAGVSSLTPQEAVEGTQAAIWTFSDAKGNIQLETKKEQQKDANVVALYNWLMAQAKGHMNDTDKPQASLSLTPATTTPQPGTKVAVTVNSTAGSAITVALADEGKTGAKLVDATGKAVAAKAMFKNGDVVYVQLPNTPTSGEVKLTASGIVSGIEAGRLFVADGPASQNLILAQAQSTPVSASADVKWAPATVPTTTPSSSPSTAPSSHPSTTPSTPASTSAPATPTASTPATGGLAHTGAGNTVPLAGGALALVAAGGGLVVYTRRTRKQSSHS